VRHGGLAGARRPPVILRIPVLFQFPRLLPRQPVPLCGGTHTLDEELDKFARRRLGELANRESTASWRQYPVKRTRRGLGGVKLVVTDDHAPLKQAMAEAQGRELLRRLRQMETAVRPAQIHRTRRVRR
jgi:hypothetical protein